LRSSSIERAALADFDAAIDLIPEYADAYRARGKLYQALGNRPRAKLDLERANAFAAE
jgi:tetratricopeptide (TPR) repeat protein